MLLDHKTLKNTLSLLRQVIPADNRFPQYKQIHFDPYDDHVVLTATNGTAFMRKRIDIAEKGNLTEAVCLKSDTFITQINNLPLKGEIEIKKIKKGYSLRVDKDEFIIPLSKTDDFPIFPSGFTPYISCMSVPLAVNLLSSSRFSAETGHANSVLTGPHIIVDGDTARIYATDGYVMSRKIIEIEKTEPNQDKVVIHRDFCRYFHGLVSQQVGKVDVLSHLEMNENFISVRTDDFQLVSKRILGKVPDCEKIISSKTEYSFEILNERLREVLKMATALDKDVYVTFDFAKDNEIFVSSDNASVGSSNSYIEYEGDKIPFQPRLNPKFFTKIANEVTENKIRIACNSLKQPLFVHDGKNCVYLVMPATAERR